MIINGIRLILLFILLDYAWERVLPYSMVKSVDYKNNRSAKKSKKHKARTLPIDLSKIKVRVYTKKNPLKSDETDLNAKNLRETHFNRKNKNLFMVQGWKISNSCAMTIIMKDALLYNNNLNIIEIDWDTLITGLYPEAVLHVYRVGVEVGKFIKEMQQVYNLDASYFTCVGLGAHICGIAGREANRNIEAIVGLDPAGPLFSSLIEYNRLSENSAKYVQVIHTSGPFVGYYGNLGTADYYVNGGILQKGCGLGFVNPVCSHTRAWEYYVESIKTSQGFTAWKCENHILFRTGYCKSNPISYLGRINLDMSAKGTYYLDTNAKPPYSVN